jgi:hypothetical protein
VLRGNVISDREGPPMSGLRSMSYSKIKGKDLCVKIGLESRICFFSCARVF